MNSFINGKKTSTVLKNYSSISVFLFFSLSLVLPSGYSFGAALLLIPSILLLPLTYKSIYSSIEIKIFSALLFAYFIVFFISFIHGDILLKDLDGPVRFLFIIPVLFFLYSYPPNIKLTYLGISIGATLAGILAIYQKMTIGLDRVGGYMAVIEFGNISILYALIAISAYSKKNNSYFNALIASSFLLGITASVLSGTRAGWISIIISLFALIKLRNKSLNIISLVKITASISLIILILYSTPNTGFKDRVNAAYNDLKNYPENTNSSIGLRLEMWRLSMYLIPEKPILGWGRDGYIDRGKEISKIHNINIKVLDFNHVHNEVFNSLLKHGILGFATLLSIYLFLLHSFSKAISNDVNKRVALSGLIFTLCIIDFGLSNVFFNRNSGVMIFCFTAVILLSLVYTKSHSYKGKLFE